MPPSIDSNAIELRASGPEAAQILRIFHALAREESSLAGTVDADLLLNSLDPGYLGNIEILEPLPDGDWRYLAFGKELVAANGIDMTGQRVSELPPQIGEAYRTMLDQVARERQPEIAVGRSLIASRGDFWERLALPCRDGENLRIVTFVRPHGACRELITAVFEASQDGMMAVRAVRNRDGKIVDGQIITANAKACEYAGYSVENMLGASFKRLFPGLVARRIWRRCVRVIRERTTDRCELNMMHQGRDAWLRVTLVSLEDGFVISFSDITDLKQALLEAQSSRAELAAEIEHRRALEVELRELSLTDDLTGVANRRAFGRALQQEIAKAKRYGSVFSIVAIDLDHFKAINDRFGHAGGDEVLMAFAAICAGELRRNIDLLARVGGEEFMLLLPGTDVAGAVDLAERLRRELAAFPISIAGEALAVTASFGVKEFDAESDPERLTIEADAALYQAKRGGRDRVVACPSKQTAR